VFFAKDDLHLMVPQRFFTHGQNALGDRHVYAARSRFLPTELIPLFECTAWPIAASDGARNAAKGPKVDVAARMRAMWESSRPVCWCGRPLTPKVRI